MVVFRGRVGLFNEVLALGGVTGSAIVILDLRQEFDRGAFYPQDVERDSCQRCDRLDECQQPDGPQLESSSPSFIYS